MTEDEVMLSFMPDRDRARLAPSLLEPSTAALNQEFAARPVGLCNPGCRDECDAATTLFDAAVVAGPILLQCACVVPKPITLDMATLVIIDAQEECRSGTLSLDGVDAALVCRPRTGMGSIE